MDAASENARFRAPLTRHLLGLGGALTVLLAGLFLPDPFARWLCVFLGTIGLVMGATRYLLSPLVLTLDGDGMTVETPLRATRIRWRHVRGLQLRRVQHNKLIVVHCEGRWQGGRPFQATKARWVVRDYFLANVFDRPLESVLPEMLARLERAQGTSAHSPTAGP